MAHTTLENICLLDKAGKPVIVRKKNVRFNLEAIQFHEYKSGVHCASFDGDNKRNVNFNSDNSGPYMGLATRSTKTRNRWGDVDLKSSSMPRLPSRHTAANVLLSSKAVPPSYHTGRLGCRH
jgi:hypothetical protein